MRLIKYAILVLLGISQIVYSSSADRVQISQNSLFSSSQREQITPYLIPKFHPALEALNSIFVNNRVTLNDTTFAAAGFTTFYTKSRSFIKVASHPSLPGYLVKVLLDSELRSKLNKDDCYWFSCRCKGARKIESIIKKNKIKHFTVAQKWIYPLPVHPSPPFDGYLRKLVILLVTDMQLISSKENKLAWKTQITKEHLDEFYLITSQAGGKSYRPDNVWLTKEGKFAFIDTEYPKSSPKYDEIIKYLNPEMQDYWLKIINK